MLERVQATRLLARSMMLCVERPELGSSLGCTPARSGIAQEARAGRREGLVDRLVRVADAHPVAGRLPLGAAGAGQQPQDLFLEGAAVLRLVFQDVRPAASQARQVVGVGSRTSSASRIDRRSLRRRGKPGPLVALVDPSPSPAGGAARAAHPGSHAVGTVWLGDLGLPDEHAPCRSPGAASAPGEPSRACGPPYRRRGRRRRHKVAFTRLRRPPGG